MAVKVTLNKSTNTLEFRPETGDDNSIATYLSDLVNGAKKNGLSKSQGAAGLLLKQAAEWDERSRSTNLSPEVRAYLAQKAADAKAQAEQLG
jgi:hypothetical protein